MQATTNRPADDDARIERAATNVADLWTRYHAGESWKCEHADIVLLDATIARGCKRGTTATKADRAAFVALVTAKLAAKVS